MKVTGSSCKNRKGFTLIEAAISLLILGLLLAPLIVLYGNYMERQKLSTSYENIYQAVDALQNYRRMNGFYPCPAPMSVDRTDADYGRAQTCRAAPFNALTPGNCVDGLCVETSIRALANPRVIVGAMPFRDLQVDEEDTYDAYGGRLYYAITESMTDIATLNDNNGAIAVRNPGGNPVAVPDGSAVYTVYHTGPTQKGAYSRDGQLIEVCSGTDLDRENCNDGFSTGSGPNNAVYLASQRNDAAGANFYDDEILFFSQISDPTWKRTLANPENIEELTPNFVGVGTPGPTEDLDISSAGTGADSMYVNGSTGLPGNGGTITTNQICDPTGANCFPPSLIAGDNTLGLPDTGMLCGAGTYMAGIQNGAPICKAIAVMCPLTTPVLTGFNGSGNPICVALPGASCPVQQRTECAANDVSLPSAIDTTLSSVFSLGACRSVQYRCSGGSWVVQSSNGNCTFTPTVTTSAAIPCGAGYTGTYTTTTTSTCGGGSGTTSTFATTCTCVGASVPENDNCSAILGGDWTGTATRTVNYPAPSCTASATAWDTSACVCAPGGTDTRACSHPDVGIGSAWLGTATRTITRTPPTCTATLGAWNTGGCSCDLTPKQTFVNHTCANPVCEEPDPSDQDEYSATVNPATCVPNTPTLVDPGSCRPKGFKWVNVGNSGSSAPSLPPSPNYIGDGCSCAQHSATAGPSTVTCFYSTDPAHNIYKCKCQ